MKFSDEELIKRIGQEMRRIRTLRGETQAMVADNCDMDEAGYRRLELGNSSPTLKSLIRVCRALEIDLIDLFTFIREDKD